MNLPQLSHGTLISHAAADSEEKLVNHASSSKDNIPLSQVQKQGPSRNKKGSKITVRSTASICLFLHILASFML